jgi:uncharacterized protein YecE (DUF72 family)
VPARLLVGCAGWALPREHRRCFPAGDSNLARYAARLNATEINSSFYRPHLPQTYAKWAASVPAAFRFSVKVPQEITHDLRLIGAGPALDAFLSAASQLRGKLGCLLLQMPPSLEFDRRSAGRFLRMLRKRHGGAIAAEPRHASWFTPEAEQAFVASRIGRVAADPARAIVDGEPGGWPGIAYYRLHGSPVVYRSAYEPAYLRALTTRLKAHLRQGRQVWCVFDNTMLGAAAANALELSRRMAAD